MRDIDDLETIELFISDEDNSGIEAISLVEFPAIEENFVALSKHKIELKTMDEEKRLVVGLALVPDKKIYRNNGGFEYNITFSKDTVRKASEKYLKSLKIHNATIEHEMEVDGVYLTESWIVEDVEKDKTALYDLDAPEGAWAVSMRIENDEVWEDVKAGKYLGFSIEGIFNENQGWDEEDLSVMKKINELLDELESSQELNKYPKEALQKKVDEHNKDVDNNPAKKTTLGKLIKVYDRGLGAYKTNPQSVRPSVKSPQQWAMARVNSFLFALRNGKYRSGKHDTDLLPEKHPMSSKQKQEDMAKSYSDYPEGARNNAKRALKWAKENGWGSCGTDVGKQRANQLANGEAITRDTIARMASFKRHQQHKDVPYSEGCGGLMWDAWGGSAGVNWAISKLKEIDNE